MARDHEAWVCIKRCGHPGCYNDATCNGDVCAQHIRKVKNQKSYNGCKTPKTQEPHLGVEIECFAADQTGHSALLAQNVIPHTDGSLPSYGAEFKLLNVPAKIMVLAPNLARRIAAVGGRVNAKCGLHVHLDARNVGCGRKESFKAWLASWEDWWFSLMPPSRQNNTYCQKVGDGNTSRYVWVSITHHETVEIRLHSGTLCPHKMRGWLAVCADLLKWLNAIEDLPAVEFDTRTRKPTRAFLSQVFGPEALEYLDARSNVNGVLVSMNNTGRQEVA